MLTVKLEYANIDLIKNNKLENVMTRKVSCECRSKRVSVGEKR